MNLVTFTVQILASQYYLLPNLICWKITFTSVKLLTTLLTTVTPVTSFKVTLF